MKIDYRELLLYAEDNDVCSYDEARSALTACEILPIYGEKTEYLSELSRELQYCTSKLWIVGYEIIIGYMVDNNLDKCILIDD